MDKIIKFSFLFFVLFILSCCQKKTKLEQFLDNLDKADSYTVSGNGKYGALADIHINFQYEQDIAYFYCDFYEMDYYLERSDEGSYLYTKEDGEYRKTKSLIDFNQFSVKESIALDDFEYSEARDYYYLSDSFLEEYELEEATLSIHEDLKSASLYVYKKYKGINIPINLEIDQLNATKVTLPPIYNE